jgi:hypothetical protein
MLYDHTKLPPILTQNIYKKNEVPFRVSSSCPFSKKKTIMLPHEVEENKPIEFTPSFHENSLLSSKSIQFQITM